MQDYEVPKCVPILCIQAPLVSGMRYASWYAGLWYAQAASCILLTIRLHPTHHHPELACCDLRGGDARALDLVDRRGGKGSADEVDVEVNNRAVPGEWCAMCAGVRDPLVLGEGGFGKVQKH